MHLWKKSIIYYQVQFIKKVFEYLRPLKNYFKSKMKTQSKAKLIITENTKKNQRDL